jgi:hypothetical protein
MAIDHLIRLKGAHRLVSDELPVLWVVSVLTNECLHVGGTINSCEPAFGALMLDIVFCSYALAVTKSTSLAAVLIHNSQRI